MYEYVMLQTQVDVCHGENGLLNAQVGRRLLVIHGRLKVHSVTVRSREPTQLMVLGQVMVHLQGGGGGQWCGGSRKVGGDIGEKK